MNDPITHAPAPQRVRAVTPEPERLAGCHALSDALAAEVGVEIDPGAIREALHALARQRRADR